MNEAAVMPRFAHVLAPLLCVAAVLAHHHGAPRELHRRVAAQMIFAWARGGFNLACQGRDPFTSVPEKIHKKEVFLFLRFSEHFLEQLLLPVYRMTFGCRFDGPRHFDDHSNPFGCYGSQS